ncbi:MAG: response regulator [Leptospiraceae bacterium]|nr:response regulator [Leptospiraceae bacterium]MDW8306388.1 response regulator [Leptospiraceae bacterium]
MPELRKDRIYNLLSALLVSGGYYFHKMLSHTTVYDSITVRLALSVSFLFNFAFSYIEVYAPYHNAIFSLLMMITSQLALGLVYINQLEETYALGTLVLLALVNVSMDSHSLLRWHTLVSALLSCAISLSSQSHHLSQKIYLIASLGLLVSTYQITDHRITLKKKLQQSLEELKLKKEQAEVAAKTREEFLARMSHEIRTPLNGILPVVELMAETPLNDEQKKLLNVVKTAGELLSTVINDILDMSKLERGEVYLSYEPHDLREMIANLSTLHRANAEKKNICFSYEIPEPPLFYEYDDVRLSQVLNNLLNNAIKFTKEGEVRLIVKVSNIDKDTDNLTFIVEDTGIGIAPEEQETIFEAFAQANRFISRQYGGTGLGLAICKHLVQAMGGKIQVESPIFEDKEKPGSRFSFSLSLRRSPPITIDRQAPNQETTLFLTGKVLVIEDNPINRMLLTTILTKTGLNVEEAENGQKGLEKAQKQPYDFIFMDIEMPDINGYELAKILRKEDNPNRNTKIICITAHAMSGDRRKALAAGMDYYLTKPFRIEEIYTLLRRLYHST